MDALEYIRKLHALVDEHGNLECQDARGNDIADPEYNDDEEPCFVLAEDC